MNLFTAPYNQPFGQQPVINTAGSFAYQGIKGMEQAIQMEFNHHLPQTEIEM